jgi:hypothetical protein
MRDSQVTSYLVCTDTFPPYDRAESGSSFLVLGKASSEGCCMSYTDADVTRTMLSHVGWVSDFLDGKRTARPIPDAITDGELMVMLQKMESRY